MSSLSSSYLQPIRSDFDLHVFVETGCYLGDGIAAALGAGFSRVYSCDLDENRVRECEIRFPEEEVILFHGSSLECLKQILADVSEPCLFWLDAHYPAFFGMADLENEQTRFPVLEELALICCMRDGAAGDVILIDDMRVIASPDNPRYRAGEVADYYRVKDLSIASLVVPFTNTHKADIDDQQEGILSLRPILTSQRSIVGSLR